MATQFQKELKKEKRGKGYSKLLSPACERGKRGDEQKGRKPKETHGKTDRKNRKT